jgi:AbiV family abortive infection protein
VASEGIDSAFARTWWRALMTNVVELLRDAFLLLGNDSPARAWSLGVLAMEELGKAEALSLAVSQAWSDGTARAQLPETVATMSTVHRLKLQASVRYGEGLPLFWAPTSPWSHEVEPGEPSLSIEDEIARGNEQRTAQARRLNLEKQAGFYVDRHDESITSPSQRGSTDIRQRLERVAGVALMHLIEDHSRMKFDAAEGVAYDGTHDLQCSLIAMGGSPMDGETI